MNVLSRPGPLLRTAACLLAALLAPPSPSSASEETIAPEVDTILQEMAGKLADAKALTYSAERTLAASRLPGHDRPQSAEIEVAVKRPHRMKVLVKGPAEDRAFHFNGRTMTVFDRKMTVYGEIACEGTIDEAVEKVAAGHGFYPPLADFLVSDPYRALAAEVTSATLLPGDEVDGEECDRMEFTQEGLEWELWVAKSDRLPRRIVVNVTGSADNPALDATMTDWNLKADLADSEFDFLPPEGAEKVEHRTSEDAEGEPSTPPTGGSSVE